MKADICIKGKYIFPGDQLNTISGCILVKGQEIMDIVSLDKMDEFIDENTSVIESGDRLIMPGFVDAHTHIVSAALNYSDYICDDLYYAECMEECVRMLKQYHQKFPEAKRIRGMGWLNAHWKDAELPDKRILDENFPDIPVYLKTEDCHSFLLNQKAIEECGLTDDMEVESGEIGKFEDGTLNGLLREADACKFAQDIYSSFTVEEYEEVIEKFIHQVCLTYGITSVGEMFPEDIDNLSNGVKAIFELDQKKKLYNKVAVYGKLKPEYPWYPETKERIETENVKIAGIKTLIDGVTASYTGYLLEPYEDKPDTCGIGVPIYKKEFLEAGVLKANELGMPVRIHAIGDRAVRMAIDVYEKAQNVYGKLDLKNTIEHIESISDQDIDRLENLNIIPSMQPIHLVLDNHIQTVRMGKERAKNGWLTKTFLEKTKELALGTDCPVVSIHPFENIYVAVTRENFEGESMAENIGENLTIAECLRAYTYGAAKSYHNLDIGVIKKGKKADIIILSDNILEKEAADILNTKVETVIFNGEILRG